MRVLWLVVSLFISCVWLFWAGQEFWFYKNKFDTKEELRRLSKSTLHLFSRGRPPSGEEFWKAVGMERPIQDPWGTPLQLTTLEGEIFEWRSAGRDRQFHTKDDLELKVPFGRGLRPDADSNEPEFGRPSTDVK